MVVGEVILEQVRLLLRQDLANVKRASGSIRVMADERAIPTAGEEFFGVHGHSQTLESPPHHVHKTYRVGFQIAFTRRVLAIPNEQAGETIVTYDETKLTRARPSVLERANEIADVLNQNDGWTLLNAINNIICPAEKGNIIEPFALLSFPEPEQVREEHFDIQPENTGLARDVRYVGLLVRLEFGGAKYIRPSRP